MYQKWFIYRNRYTEKMKPDSGGGLHPGDEKMPYRFIFSYNFTRWMHRREAARDLFPFAALSAAMIAPRSASAFTEASDPVIPFFSPAATARRRDACRCSGIRRESRDIATACSRTLCSSRTLPGQADERRIFLSYGERSRFGSPPSEESFARIRSAISPMSSLRSRRGGIRIGITLIREWGCARSS